MQRGSHTGAVHRAWLTRGWHKKRKSHTRHHCCPANACVCQLAHMLGMLGASNPVLLRPKALQSERTHPGRSKIPRALRYTPNSHVLDCALAVEALPYALTYRFAHCTSNRPTSGGRSVARHCTTAVSPTHELGWGQALWRVYSKSSDIYQGRHTRGRRALKSSARAVDLIQI